MRTTVALLVSPLLRESKTVSESGFHGLDSGFQVLLPGTITLSLELGIWIPTVSGIPDSASKKFPDLGILISLHGATCNCLYLWQIRARLGIFPQKDVAHSSLHSTLIQMQLKLALQLFTLETTILDATVPTGRPSLYN